MDTIFALASARGKAGVAVVRISGPRASAALDAFDVSSPPPHRAALRRLFWRGQTLDEALVIAFPEGGSFTGESVAELHLHGGVATVQAVLGALSEIEGLRLAEPGEFTRRALENERLDLAQIEGLADLVEAETEAQRIQAMRVFSGALGDLAENWRRDLIRAAALIEATIDFADEEVPVDVSDEVLTLLAGVSGQLAAELSGMRMSERVREGFEVAIVGAPNVGKSTLLNKLAGRSAAITSKIAGTTRDVIEVRMDLSGLPVTVLDTAGLRDTSDEVEGIGIARAIERANTADIRVFLLGDEGLPDILQPQVGDIVVAGKSDLNPAGEGVSGLTGAGISDLIARITSELETRMTGAATATRHRHRVAMTGALASLREADTLVNLGETHAELAAEEIRTGIRALDSIVGRVDVEHLLDEIFASFCLGK